MMPRLQDGVFPTVQFPPLSEKFVLNKSPDTIKPDAIAVFVDTWEKTLAGWIDLLRKTTIPDTEYATPAHIASAVHALENVITGELGEILPPKFGLLQLANFLDALEDRIKTDRISWMITHERTPGKRAATIATDLYLNAQGLDPRSASHRNMLSTKRSAGRRLRGFAAPSSLLLIIYSDYIEKIVYVLASIYHGKRLIVI